MAIFHMNVKVGNKSTSSAKAKADYILRDGKYEKNREKPAYTESGHMPAWAIEPRNYWQAADEYERSNGRLYVQVEVALPAELSFDEQIELCHKLAKNLTERNNLPYTFVLHSDKKNPHCHMIISERINDGTDRLPESWFRKPDAKKNPGAGKAAILKRTEELTNARAMWADIANAALEKAGRSERIDHRSHEDRGLVDVGIRPMIHEGFGPDREERRKVNDEIMDGNRAIQAIEPLLEKFKTDLVGMSIEQKLNHLGKKIDSELKELERQEQGLSQQNSKTERHIVEKEDLAKIAEELKGDMGAKTTVVAAQEGRRYSGPIVKITGSLVAQKISPDSAVIHDVRNFENDFLKQLDTYGFGENRISIACETAGKNKVDFFEEARIKERNQQLEDAARKKRQEQANMAIEEEKERLKKVISTISSLGVTTMSDKDLTATIKDLQSEMLNIQIQLRKEFITVEIGKIKNKQEELIEKLQKKFVQQKEHRENEPSLGLIGIFSSNRRKKLEEWQSKDDELRSEYLQLWKAAGAKEPLNKEGQAEIVRRTGHEYCNSEAEKKWNDRVQSEEFQAELKEHKERKHPGINRAMQILEAEKLKREKQAEKAKKEAEHKRKKELHEAMSAPEAMRVLNEEQRKIAEPKLADYSKEMAVKYEQISAEKARLQKEFDAASTLRWSLPGTHLDEKVKAAIKAMSVAEEALDKYKKVPYIHNSEEERGKHEIKAEAMRQAIEENPSAYEVVRRAAEIKQREEAEKARVEKEREIHAHSNKPKRDTDRDGR